MPASRFSPPAARILGVLVYSAALACSAPRSQASAEAPLADPRSELRVEVFSRKGCPHCAAAQAYLRELQRARPELRVRRYDVVDDRAALDRLRKLAAEAGVAQAAVPTSSEESRP